MLIKFEKVTQRARKVCTCSQCGKLLRRSKTFMQTISPFNLHALLKLPKTREQIRSELRDTASAWERKPEMCAYCRNIGPNPERIAS